MHRRRSTSTATPRKEPHETAADGIRSGSVWAHLSDLGRSLPSFPADGAASTRAPSSGRASAPGLRPRSRPQEARRRRYISTRRRPAGSSIVLTTTRALTSISPHRQGGLRFPQSTKCDRRFQLPSLASAGKGSRAPFLGFRMSGVITLGMVLSPNAGTLDQAIPHQSGK